MSSVFIILSFEALRRENGAPVFFYAPHLPARPLSQASTSLSAHLVVCSFSRTGFGKLPARVQRQTEFREIPKREATCLSFRNIKITSLKSRLKIQKYLILQDLML
jgi:hypothetical protein